MNLHISLAKLASVTGGTLHAQDPQRILDRFTTDSRTLHSGDAFWALRGSTYDGHAFIEQAFQKGATLVVAEAGRAGQLPAGVDLLEVKDSLKALQELAKYHRLRHMLKVAAITGSNGKSTTKQMLLAICSRAGQTVANIGNLNNQFGVPFSLLEIQPQHEYGVFELGASHRGDIAETAALAVPDVAVITNVSAAHLAFFKDLETVYQTKTEIVDCLAAAGTLVYNVDDEMLSRLGAYKGKTIAFGFSPRADLRILEGELFRFMYKGTAYTVDLPLERHDKFNAAAAVAAAIGLGLFMDEILQGLRTYIPMPMRLQHMPHGRAELILDCYNANPASMANALDILGRQSTRPRIAVLGDMRELGDTSRRYHRLVASWLLNNKIDYAFLAGAEMKAAADALSETPVITVRYGLTPQAWTAELKKLLQDKGGVCLLKASRGMQFEKIVEEI